MPNEVPLVYERLLAVYPVRDPIWHAAARRGGICWVHKGSTVSLPAIGGDVGRLRPELANPERRGGGKQFPRLLWTHASGRGVGPFRSDGRRVLNADARAEGGRLSSPRSTPANQGPWLSAERPRNKRITLRITQAWALPPGERGHRGDRRKSAGGRGLRWCRGGD